MGFSIRLCRLAVLATLLLIFIPGVSGWTLQNWSVTPAGKELLPGTAVAAGYSLHFDSWMTGSTFDKDNSLTMNTDLVNPQWVVRKIETMDDQPPIIEPMPVRQSSQVKIDGWSLSYVRKRFDISVELTGKIPDRSQSGTISIVRIQDVSSGAKPVAGTLVKKEVQVVAITPEPTPVPAEITINLTPAEIIEVTSEVTPATTSVPTKKVTYSPGPEPLLVTGLLSMIICIGHARRKN
jgi:hypothetical protein